MHIRDEGSDDTHTKDQYKWRFKLDEKGPVVMCLAQ